MDAAALALKLYPWCFPPLSDAEDALLPAENARRVRDGMKPKKPRDWTPTRDFALECARKVSESDTLRC